MSSVISTREGMAAISLVEQFRHESKALNSYLDTENERKKLSQELTDFYHKNGVADVTPEMIADAVAAYKRDRLTFSGFSGSLVAKKFASFMLGVHFYWKMIFAFTLCGVFSVFLMFSMHQFHIHSSSTRLVEEYDRTHQAFSRLTSSVFGDAVDSRDDWREHSYYSKHPLTEEFTRQTMEEHERLIRDMKKLHGKAQGIDIPVLKVDEVKEDYDAYKTRYDGLLESIVLINNEKISINTEIKNLEIDAEKLWAIESMLLAKLESDGYKKHVDDSDVKASLSTLLSSVSAGNIRSASAEMDAFTNLLNSKNAITVLRSELASVENAHSAVFKDEEGRNLFQVYLEAARSAAESGDERGFAAATSSIKSLRDQVVVPLTVRVVDHPEVRSGVTRNFNKDSRVQDPNAPKRYYLILEAVDASGKPKLRPVYNVETKKTEVVPFWGQQVSAEAYEDMKKDKLDDGVVDNRMFGEKSAGAYTLKFNRPVLDGTITRW